MGLIRLAIERPIAVVAAVLMILIFGVLALQRIPIQLTPDVRKPVITVTTYWSGGSPIEMEREVINRQEEVLKGVQGVSKIESRSQDGRGILTLEFEIDSDMNKSLLMVSNRLNQISDYPAEANKPLIDTSGLEDNPIAWFILTRLPGNNRALESYGDFAENVIQDRLERVAGVSRTNLYGGSENEMRIIVDPDKLARYRLTVPDLVSALRLANVSISAGDINEGKRRYIVRTEGELQTVNQIRSVVLTSTNTETRGGIGRVTIGDVADVRFTFKEPRAKIRFLGDEAIAINAVRATGANVIKTMAGISKAIDELNSYAVPQAGLAIEQVYDETIYINSAISLVQQNIYVGGTFAVLILIAFLRSFRATLIISMAIPVSVVASFVAMAAMGRSINVISLAGIAFAVGMVVDAAIVVLENIFRHRENGLPAHEAALQGTRQVWSAVMVSALTTVLVFVPILVMQLEAGQLFRDIAVAISVAVLMSLLVSITMIPALSKRLLKDTRPPASRIALPIIDGVARGVARLLLGYTGLITKSRVASALVVIGLVFGTGTASYLFLPKMEYLPEGNRNLIFGVMLPPPGYNLDTMNNIAMRIEDKVRHLWASVTGPIAEPGKPPKIGNFFFVALPNMAFFGAGAVDRTRVAELIPVLTETLYDEPGTFGFFNQPSLFSREIGGARTVALDISGSDLEAVITVAQKAAGIVGSIFPRSDGHQMRPKPGLVLGAPEVRIYPNRVLLADNGVSAIALGQSIDAFNDGLRVAEITVDGRRIDLTLRGLEDKIDRTQGLANLPVVTADGRILPVSSLADIEITVGPTEVRHLERERTVTLQIMPAPSVALEEAIEMVQTQVIDKIAADGLPPGITLSLSGTADQLSQTFEAMMINFIVAIVIVYLLMAVLFESFLYPFIIMLSVPTAAAGGVLGLGLLNLLYFQPLDMLTLLGFIILVGIVVNNAILLVHQTLYHMRTEAMAVRDAILEATRNRLRPIFMSTLTSVFGMLPLVLVPGAGSELYRGLGSVVIGGLALSAILTLLMVPALLSLFVSQKETSAFKTKSSMLEAAAE
ncbi:MAG: Efflux pump membrane transporter BepE [Alphaproteobacteria bacterium MarineAlpha9_Bin5]|nr:MAG: Efflux pump membrane transporter BepE [Alphaproteobacteria bacterium MarineAlpha9_Bin6]PPR36911.1 MAG: Efflux pump membrane transporter BepE [Alphaproteobacteria bacterium MarineAlpha9_Bin5]